MTNTEEQAAYISRPHKPSKGQEYRLYPDRIELHSKILFRTLRIPFESIREIGLRPKPKFADLFVRPFETWWSFNNDWAAFHPHIYLYRKGWPPRIRFAPDNPDEFMSKYLELNSPALDKE